MRRRSAIGWGLALIAVVAAVALVVFLGRLREPQPLRIRADLEDRGVGVRGVTLYYLEPGSAHLTPRLRQVLAEESASDLARRIVSHLSAPDEEAVRAALPAGTELLHYFEIGNGEAVLDFNERIVDLGGDSIYEERQRLTALYRSIAENLEGVRALRLLVHGRPVERWDSHLSGKRITSSG